MNRPQLLCAAMAFAIGASACQRSEPADVKQNAQAAAAEAKTRAARAWDRFADAWITTIIESKLVGDREIRARDIDVSTRDGVVTLKGRVLNEPLRQLAVVLAKNTNGVKGVNDQLAVQIAPPVATRTTPPTSATAGAVATTGSPSAPIAPTPDDARITAAVQSKYFLDDRIKQRRIDVSSSDGVVTLSGEVGDDSERAQALLLARTTDGVTRVEDHLAVAAPPQTAESAAAPVSGSGSPAAIPTGDEALVSRVQARLSTDATANGGPVEVTAKNGVVLLQGTVPTAAVKQRVLSAARGVEGVTQVVDRIGVGASKR